jgi:hypothetical protein
MGKNNNKWAKGKEHRAESIEHRADSGATSNQIPKRMI